jgi:F-type H+-transporting ATPase subunit epsilon
MAQESKKLINFKIATPERVVFKDEVDQITLPTKIGEITILPNHIPLISVLAPGEIKVRRGNSNFAMSVSGGFIEVQAEKVIVLADTAERAEEIDIIRAEEAKKRAQEAMSQKNMDAIEFAALAAQIEKEMARIRVGRKYKNLDNIRGIGKG